ncbi:MAG: hypothetical protein WC455_30990 [Dehalococcoidia bacterium]|jgi:hypothetical protein
MKSNKDTFTLRLDIGQELTAIKAAGASMKARHERERKELEA